MNEFEGIPTNNSYNIGKKSVLDKIKPNILKRREALMKARERGFENLEDFRIGEIKIERIIKKPGVSQQCETASKELGLSFMANTPIEERMEGSMSLESFLFGDKPVKMNWFAEVKYDRRNKESKMLKDYYEIIIDWQREGDEYHAGKPDFIRKREDDHGFDIRYQLYGKNGSPTPDHYIEIEIAAFKEIEKYVRNYALPETVISDKFHDSEFNVRLEVSEKTEEELLEELADSLERGTVDGKFIYAMGGAEKFLEAVREEGYENIRVEKEIIQNNLEELEAETGEILFDFGCGDGSKAKPLLKKAAMADKKIKYCPVDISARMVFEAANNAPEGTETEGLLFDFTKDFKDKVPADKKATLAIFGSTLGNGDAEYQEKLMQNFGSAMKEGDNALIGLQLNYDFQEILKKYQDPQVSEFARPMLAKLGIGKDDAELFISSDEKEKMISLNIRMLKDKELKVGKNTVNLPQGKIINLIVSHKYEIPEMEHLAQISGLQIKKSFLNPESSYGLFVLEK